MSAQYTKKERVILGVMLLLVLAVLLFVNFFPKYKELFDEGTAELIDLAVSRLLSGGIFLCLLLFLGTPVLSFRRIPGGKALLITLPAWAIAVNNFPILGLLTGSVRVTESAEKGLLLAAACIGIGLFEELAFRGVVFPALLSRILKRLRTDETTEKKLPTETLAVFLSIVLTSAAFGLVHLLNLLSGGSPLGVLTQIGYSFLIGGMCAIVLLKTRCVWLPVLIHALYDFGGLMFQYLCEGKLWDTPTVILTVAVSLLVAAFYLLLLFTVKKKDVESFLSKNSN